VTAETAARIHTLLTTHACHPRCVAARGPICECRCDGGNHGLLWEMQPRIPGLEPDQTQDPQEAQP